MKYMTDVDSRTGELTLERTGDRCRFRYVSERGDTDVREASVLEVETGIYSVLLNGKSYEAKVVTGADGYYVDLSGHRSVVQVRDPREASPAGKHGLGEGRQTVVAPMPGKVVRVLVNEGDQVEPGDGLVVVEAMKMQNELKAPKAGKVVQLKAVVGATVGHGEMLAAIE
jgi:biotin carboxyl carrier protein